MTDLTDDNIKDLLKLSNTELRAELNAMLTTPNYPEHMLGRWATHEELGDVLVVYDHPDSDGDVSVSWPSTDPRGGGAEYVRVHVSELTFPEQTTKPEDVPVGGAWLVNAPKYDHTRGRAVALKTFTGLWMKVSEELRDADDVDDYEDPYDTFEVRDEDVTLIAPLVPASTPAPAVEWVKDEEEYDALPEGSIVLTSGLIPWIKLAGDWECPSDVTCPPSSEIFDTLCKVVRKGWRNE